MNTFYNTVENLKTSWQALKEMAVVTLTGDLALKISGNLQGIVDAFKEYFDAEDDKGRADALEKVKQNIIEIITAVKDGIQEGLKALEELSEEFKGSEDSTVRAIGTVLGGIVDALEWFTKEENWETVKRGFEALIGVWAAGKIGSAVGNLASFASHIATIKSAAGLGGVGAAAGGGIGSFITTAGYLAVGLMMVAPTVQKLFDPKTWQQSETEKAIDEAVEKTDMGAVKELNKEAGITNQDLLKTVWNRMTNSGDQSVPERKEKEETPTSWENPDWRSPYQQGYPSNYYNPNMVVPADSWTNDRNELTSDDISGFRTLPDLMAKSVRNGVSNIVVSMDGQKVGQLVAPYVSQMIARDIVS